jgi:hypothetical protein
MGTWLSGTRIFSDLMRPDAPKGGWRWFLLAVPGWIILFYLIHELTG